jgi:hypothetical protein
MTTSLSKWLLLHESDVRNKSCSAELYALPSDFSIYKDENAWNQVYVSLYKSVTTGPMIQIVDRFIRNIPPSFFSNEHFAFVERVCVDGLERNPPNFVPHFTKIEAARAYEKLAILRADHKLSAYAAMYVGKSKLAGNEDDIELCASLTMQRAFMYMEQRCVVGALIHATQRMSSSRYSDWRHSYSLLHSYAMRIKNEWSEEERSTAFERLIYAATVSDHPMKWMEAAANLYVNRKERPPSSVVLKNAVARCKSSYGCDPWYVRFLNSVIS